MGFRYISAPSGRALTGFCLGRPGLGLAAAAVLVGTIIGLLEPLPASGFLHRPVRCRHVCDADQEFAASGMALLVYFALPQAGIRLDKYESFIGALALYSGAYLTEVFRGGLLSVPKGVVKARVGLSA